MGTECGVLFVEISMQIRLGMRKYLIGTLTCTRWRIKTSACVKLYWCFIYYTHYYLRSHLSLNKSKYKSKHRKVNIK